MRTLVHLVAVLVAVLLAAAAPRPAGAAAAPPAPAGGSPTPDPAAEAAAEAAFELPAIEVRGRRAFPRAAADPAAAASVVTREELERPGVDLPAVLETAPGVAVDRLGGLGSFATVRIRGSTGEQVRVYIDGVLRNAADGGPVDLGALPLGPIDRVEIYRSVAPVGFGGSAMGGVVRIRTRQADERRLELALTGGSFSTRGARAFWSEPGRRLDGVVSLDYEGSAGDFRFAHDNGTAWTSADDRTVERANNHFDALSGMGRVRLHLSRQVSLSVQSDLRWRDRGLPGVALFETRRAGLEELEAALTLGAVWEGRPPDADTAGEDEDGGPAPADGAVPSWETHATLSFLRRELFDPDAEIGLGQKDTDDRSWSARAGTLLRWPLLGWLSPAAALDWRYERFAPQNAFATPPAGAASARHVVEGSAEIALDIAPLDLTVVPSAGFEVAASTLHARDAFGQAQDAARDVMDAEWSVRLGLTNDSLPWTLLRANAGRSVRLPSLFELFGDTGYVRGNPALAPETAWFVDVGVVHEAAWLPAPQRLELEISGFFQAVDDLIQFVQTSQNVTHAENVASAHLAGVEAAVRADLFRHVRLQGSFTWLFSEDTSDIAARAGRELPYRPRWRWQVRAEAYGRFGADVPEAGLFLEADGLAGNHLDPANLVRTPDRAFLAVGAYGWFLERRLRLDLVARNLLDARAVDLAGFPLPGRAVFASLLWRVF